MRVSDKLIKIFVIRVGPRYTHLSIVRVYVPPVYGSLSYRAKVEYKRRVFIMPPAANILALR